MGDQNRKTEREAAAQTEEIASIAARKAKRCLLNRDMLAKLQKKKDEQRRRARRFVVNAEILEANGIPGRGAQLIDLSMNGAKLEMPFSPPFMSQMVLKFALQGSQNVIRVVGRVIWSKMTLQRGWFEVGIQFYQNYWEIDQYLRLMQR
jgi:hypothetical protein